MFVYSYDLLYFLSFFSATDIACYGFQENENELCYNNAGMFIE
jgi:hypothetical protein